MKKEIFAMGLLLIMLAGVFVNLAVIKDINKDMLKLIEDTKEFAQKGEWDKAAEKAEEVGDFWNSKHHYTHIVMRHAELDDVTFAFCNLLTEVYKRDIGGVLGSSKALTEQINGLYEMERVKIGTIF